MESHPLPLLPFDHVGAEQLEWDGATDEITFAAPVSQVFRCAHDQLHRVEIFIQPTFHFKRSHLWLLLLEGGAPDSRASASPPPVRVAGPLAAGALAAHGWFSFEFEPVAASAGRTFTFVLHAPDAAPGNALAVRATTRAAPASRGLFVAGRPRAGALTFRASCVRAPALLANFQRFRRGARQRTGTIDYEPLLARLEISRPCNLHCVMCQRGLHPFDASREAPGFMSLPIFRALDPVLPTLLRVVALGLGEPFLNPHLLAILRHARARNAFAHIFTSTNGTCLSDAAIDAILDEGLLSELQISLDGAERETFERIRRKASFDTVVGAFERVTAARARRGRRTLGITAAMLVMKPNFTQVVAFVQRMAALGVDRISLDSPKDAAFKPLRADSNDEMARIMEQVAAAGEWLAGTGTELSGPLLSELLIWHRTSGQRGTPPRWGADECAQLTRAPDARIAACGVPWESFVLAADGTVNVCCNSIRRMGHVRDTAIGQAWAQGAPYHLLRGELVTRTLHQDCRTCLGENFVVPGEATPAIYLDGCLCDTASTTSLAQRLGRSVASNDALLSSPAPLRAGIDPLEWRIRTNHTTTPWRINGWIETADATQLHSAPLEPIRLAITVDGVVRAFTCAAVATPGFAQWSASIEDVPRPDTPLAIGVYRIDGDALRRLAPAPARPAPQLHADSHRHLHGFVDEVRHTGRTVHLIGWARDATARAPAHRVGVIIENVISRSLAPWLPRPDVARAFGDAEGSFGYSLELPLEFAADARARSYKMAAIDELGRTAELEWSEDACAALERALDLGRANVQVIARRSTGTLPVFRKATGTPPAPLLQNSSVCCSASRLRGSSVLNARSCIIESPAT